jgi:hypothetical protein
MREISILFVLGVVLASCGTADETSDTTQVDPTVEKAVNDLASRLDATADEIEVERLEEVTWSDGSLGCPEPGMVYTQALVEGSRVVLEHEGRFYDYHAGADDNPFLCESDADDGGYDSIPPLEGAVSE